MMSSRRFDCIVIGAGHAGIEAAHAAAKLGASTALITIRADTIAKASCNPAIGGLAKGQIVREIDALGGLMGLAADAAGIQFRLLNSSKGPAVRSPRAQIDRHRYCDWMRQRLEDTENLTIISAIVTGINTEGGKVTGVECSDGRSFAAEAVIAAPGTFLRGLMHLGTRKTPGGRLDEPASDALSGSLTKLGLATGRLKTGTPPRLDASTVDQTKLDIQKGDAEPSPFSFMTDSIDRPQTPCWITYTNENIHRLLRDNLHRAPLYSGQITSAGPRYCPSIEVKIVRFGEKNRHQVFLEPEEEEIRVIYCNGISTSVPPDIQNRMLAMMPGTERARVIHYGYAIEYDYCPPRQLRPSLETKRISGLFLAGQINGTSGYEEAAGQGIIAGINAAMKLKGAEPFVLGRDRAYIGVMIDDLLIKDIDEPYRMFTSRAEYRLSLRSDNADRRLTPAGRKLGLVDGRRWNRFTEKLEKIKQIEDRLRKTRRGGKSLWDELRRPGSSLAAGLHRDPEILKMRATADQIEAVIIDAKYEGYLAKQERLAGAFRQLSAAAVPDGIDYSAIEHLRAEARQKLELFRPATLAQAAATSGVTPADITVLQIFLKKHHGLRP